MKKEQLLCITTKHRVRNNSEQKFDSLQEIFLITPNKEEKTKTRNLAEFTSPIQVKIKHRLDDPLPNTYHYVLCIMKQVTYCPLVSFPILKFHSFVDILIFFLMN